MADEATTTTTNKQLILQKIYIKDFSFESPKAPEVFTTNVSPQTQLNIRSGNKDVGNDNVEVTLTLTVESKNNDDTLFLIEIVQAGVFLIQGYSAEERGVLIGSFCPSTLYPFAREAISDMATKGGFPQLLLQPINFDALYAQAMQQRSQQAAGQPVAPVVAPEAAADGSTSGETH
jgi:preprotein translocase subunit SecB